MPKAEPFGHQPVLRGDHVSVRIAGEARPEPIGGLGGAAGADRIGQDDEIPRRIQGLARTEQLAAEARVEHAAPAAAGAVQDQHRGRGRIAERRIGKAQLGQRFAGGEADIAGDPDTVSRRGLRMAETRQRQSGEPEQRSAATHPRVQPQPAKGSRSVIVSSRSGLVDSSTTGASTSSSIRRTYFTAAAGSWA